MSIVTYGLGQNGDTFDFTTVYGFGILQAFPLGLIPSHLYIIPEELRFFSVFIEDRDCLVIEEERLDSIKFEDRVIKVRPKDN
jgi:hypothetical protein